MSRLIWGSSVPSKPEEGPKQSRLAQFFPSSAATTTSSALPPLDGDGPIRNDEAFVSGDANRLNRSGPSGGSGQGGGGGRRGGNGGGGGDARPRGITFMDGEVAPAVFDNSPYSRAFVSAWRGHREDAMGQQQQQPPQQHQQANVMLPAGGGGGGAFGGAPSGASGGGSTLFAFAGYPTIGGASSVPRTASTPTAADLPPFVVRPRGSRSSAAVSVAAPSSSSHPFPPSSHMIGHSVSGGVASESMARPTAMAMASLPTASGCASSRASSGAAGMRSPSPFAPAPADCLLSNGGGPSAIATSTVSTNSGSVSLASAFTAAYMLGLVSPSPSNGIGGGAGRPLSGSVVPPPQSSAPPQAAASRGGGGGNNAYAAVTDFDFLLLTPYLPEQGPQPSSGTPSLSSSGPLHVSENGLVGDRPAVRSSSQGPSPRRRVLGRIMFEASVESERNGGVGGETGNKGCKGAGMGGTISEAAENSNGNESGSEGEDELLPADGEGPVTDSSGGVAVAVVTHPSSDAADEAAVMDEVQLLTPAAAAEVSTLFIDPSRYPHLRMLPAIPFGLTLDGGNNGRVVAGGVHQLLAQQQHSAAAASGPITLPTAATPLPLPASHPLPTPIPPQWRGIFANCVFFLNSCDADRLVSLYVLEKLIRFMGGVTVMGLSTRTVTFVVSQHLSSTKEQRVKPQAARVSFGGGGGRGKEKEVVAPAAGAAAPTPSELARRPPPLTVRLLDTNALAASSSVKGGGGMGGGVGGGAYASSSSASLRLAAKRLADAERYVHPHFILACAKMGRRVPSAPFRTMVAPPPSASSLHPARSFFSAVVPPSAAAAAIEATAGPLEGPLVFDSVAAIVPYYARCAADAAARKRRGGGGGVAHGRFPAAPEVSSAAFPQRGPSLVGAVIARACATHGVASVAGQKRSREGTAEGIIDLSPDGGYI